MTYPQPLLITTGAVSPPVAVVAPPPTVTAAHESAALWRESGRAGKRSRTPPIGTTISFVLNEPAKVTFSFTQRVVGRVSRRSCVPLTRRNNGRRGCMRWATVAGLSLAGQTGANTVFFQGRLPGGRRLRPGHYTLVILATSAAGLLSTPTSVTFTIR